NIGVTTGQYTYVVDRTYSLARLLDTLDSYLAVIVAIDSGLFDGFQTNSITNVTTKTSGPIGCADTTYLDLFSGRVVKRSLRITIPTQVDISTAKPFTDFLDVHSEIVLDESNATRLKPAATDTTVKAKTEEPKAAQPDGSKSANPDEPNSKLPVDS